MAMTIHRTPLALFAGTAFSLPAIASDPAMVPVMPEQIEDSCSLYALVDSAAMVTTYTAVPIEDIDGDGSVTDADFAEWVKTNIAPNLVIRDVNGDGYLTAVDEVAALAVVLDKLSGDLNADGAVTLDDTTLFLEMFLNPPADATGLSDVSADVTLDGAVTAEDLNAHITTLNPGLQTDRVADAVKVLITLQGSLTRSYYTQGHIDSITEGWGPDRHCAETSGFSRPNDRRRFPPNHDFAISRDWPGNHSVHVSENWPAQHRLEVSEGWPWPGDRPGQHRMGTSTGWPPNHGRTQSEHWDEPPNGPHLTVLSALWPPDHDFVQSRTPGPSDHYAPISEMDPDPGFPPPGYPALPDHLPGPVVEHQQSHSGTWWPHNVALSGFFWPPNHLGAISNSWEDASHVISISQQWPATHHEYVSRRWQPNDDGEYPRWPPNHDTSVSTPGEGPADPPPPPARPWWLPNLFPPGHDVSTTIQQWLPFFP
tara:strand:- start:112 stop:1557 length:1446 start_codon:yes stop_codon:yes gene_type:complete